MVGGVQTSKPTDRMKQGRTNYVHITRDNGLTFEELPSLPYDDAQGRVFFVNEKTVLYYSTLQIKNVLILDLAPEGGNMTWREGPDMIWPRVHVHVGLVTRSSGEKELVIAGGIPFANGGGVAVGSHQNQPADTNECKARCNCRSFCTGEEETRGQDGGYLTKKVEIYNIANNTMREGNDAPQFWARGTTHPYMDSFLVSPCNAGDNCCSLDRPKEIWRYNIDDTWTRMPGKHAVAMYHYGSGTWVDDLCH